MKNRIRNKLRSRDGASLTFALLLFLVCAVLCSVVLAAATAASGRMSRIADSDQRYYAVTSGSELLKDLLDGKTVSIVEETVSSSKVTYTDDAAGSPSPVTLDGDGTRVYLFDKAANSIAQSDYTADSQISGDGAGPSASSLISDSIEHDAAYTAIFNSMPGGSVKKNLTLSLSSGGSTVDGAAVRAEETLNQDGTIVFVVHNDDTDEDAEHYTLELTFECAKEETKQNSSSQGPKEDVTVAADGSVSWSVTTTKTERTITSLTWNLMRVRTVEKEAAGG